MHPMSVREKLGKDLADKTAKKKDKGGPAAAAKPSTRSTPYPSMGLNLDLCGEFPNVLWIVDLYLELCGEAGALRHVLAAARVTLSPLGPIFSLSHALPQCV